MLFYLLYCILLHLIIFCCTVLYFIVLYYILFTVLYFVVVYCILLYCILLYCILLCFIVFCCIVFFVLYCIFSDCIIFYLFILLYCIYFIVLYCILLFCIIFNCTVFCCASLYFVVPYCILLYGVYFVVLYFIVLYYSLLYCIVFCCTVVVLQWLLGILGTISAFAYRHRETEKNLCRGGRSQEGGSRLQGLGAIRAFTDSSAETTTDTVCMSLSIYISCLTREIQKFSYKPSHRNKQTHLPYKKNVDAFESCTGSRLIYRAKLSYKQGNSVNIYRQKGKKHMQIKFMCQAQSRLSSFTKCRQGSELGSELPIYKPILQ